MLILWIQNIEEFYVYWWKNQNSVFTISHNPTKNSFYYQKRIFYYKFSPWQVAYYKSILRKNGVKVVSATEAIAEDSTGILLESLLGGYAEFYSVELSEKVRRGLTENALKCKYNGGNVPLGYFIDDDLRYQIDTTTSPFIFEAFAVIRGVCEIGG